MNFSFSILIINNYLKKYELYCSISLIKRIIKMLKDEFHYNSLP